MARELSLALALALAKLQCSKKYKCYLYLKMTALQQVKWKKENQTYQCQNRCADWWLLFAAEYKESRLVFSSPNTESQDPTQRMIISAQLITLVLHTHS